MKKKFLCIVSMFVLTCFTPTTVFSNGYPVFDASGWLAAIDQLYQAYDMVNNTITQIENQYKAIQHSIEVAKSIDWENIRFDGDFDIRNDIKDANRRVNKLLTQARNIKNTITTPSINCGNVKYSIADLCGCTTSNTWEDRKNLFTAVSDYKYYMTTTMKTAVDDVVKGLDEKQRKAIWVKYGISPKNYVFVQQSQTAVIDSASKVMAKCTEEAERMKAEEAIARKNTVVQAALENLDSDGSPTSAGMQEAQLHLTGQLVEQMEELSFAINDVGQIAASRAIQEEAQKQAEADEAARAEEIREKKDNKVSSRFRKE